MFAEGGIGMIAIANAWTDNRRAGRMVLAARISRVDSRYPTTAKVKVLTFSGITT